MMPHEAPEGRLPAGRPGSHHLLPITGITVAVVAVLAHLAGGAALAHLGLGASLVNLGGSALVVGLAALITLKLLVVFAARKRMVLMTKKPSGMTAGNTIHWARFYDPLVAILTLGQGRALRDRTIAQAHIAPGERVLDVGCGTGELTMRAKARTGAAGSVTGIDAAPEMIAVARQKAARARLDVAYHVAAVEALPFPDATFDVVLSSLMMHHLPEDLKPRALAEMRRVLKPGGRALVVDFTPPPARLGRLALVWLSHRRTTASGVQHLPALLEAAGFSAIEAGDAWRGYLGFVRGRVGR